MIEKIVEESVLVNLNSCLPGQKIIYQGFYCTVVNNRNGIVDILEKNGYGGLMSATGFVQVLIE